MENIYQINHTLVYQIQNSSNNVASLILAFIGTAFILLYFLHIPFYWMRNPKYPLPKVIPLLVGFALLTSGISNFFFSVNTKAVFDKSQKELLIITENRLKEVDRKSYSLAQIKSISIKKGKKTRNDYEYFLTVNLNNNQPILLFKDVETQSYTDLLSEGKKISSFINVPLKIQ